MVTKTVGLPWSIERCAIAAISEKIVIIVMMDRFIPAACLP